MVGGYRRPIAATAFLRVPEARRSDTAPGSTCQTVSFFPHGVVDHFSRDGRVGIVGVSLRANYVASVLVDDRPIGRFVHESRGEWELFVDCRRGYPEGMMLLVNRFRMLGSDAAGCFLIPCRP